MLPLCCQESVLAWATWEGSSAAKAGRQEAAVEAIPGNKEADMRSLDFGPAFFGLLRALHTALFELS